MKREKLEQERNKEAETKNEIKGLYNNLASEIEINQNRLLPLNKVLDSDFEISDEDKLPEGLIFESRIYSASLDKLGWLDTDKRDNLIKYYSELTLIEDEYKNLELLHGFLTKEYMFFKIDESTMHDSDKPKPGWNEIEIFLKHTMGVYSLGRELMICLKE